MSISFGDSTPAECRALLDKSTWAVEDDPELEGRMKTDASALCRSSRSPSHHCLGAMALMIRYWEEGRG